MIPHEKALVERLKDKPFALVGINSDGPVEKVRKICAENGIPWRNAVDGDIPARKKGPLATRWNIDGWPTTFVLDAKGVIRYRNADLDKAADTLLREIEKK